jgi:hypothetical protein
MAIALMLYGKANAARHDDQSNEINRWRDKELSNDSRKNG